MENGRQLIGSFEVDALLPETRCSLPNAFTRKHCQIGTFAHGKPLHSSVVKLKTSVAMRANHRGWDTYSHLEYILTRATSKVISTTSKQYTKNARGNCNGPVRAKLKIYVQ